MRVGIIFSMPLSEHEQRILDDIAKRLAEDDPQFAESVRSATPRRHAFIRLRLAIFGFVAGLVLFVAGLLAGTEAGATENTGLFTPQMIFWLAGLSVMLFSIMSGVRASRALGSAVVDQLKAQRAQQQQPRGVRDRLEDRWKRRMDSDDR